jgi:MarR family transcriptional regulator, 2-MHQ and catechol-resistance regulon repressor
MSTGRLQRELKKRKPFKSLAEKAALNLARTSDRFAICFERLFRRHGLQSGSQYNILRILRGAGGPLPVLEIASQTITAVPGITGLIDRLEKAGLVERRRCAEDRRVVHVSITDKGVALLADLDKPVQELNERLLGNLSVAEKKELIRLLEKARSSLDGE